MRAWPRPVDHDVGRLQISVQHPLLVSRRQTRAKLLGNLDALVPGQTPDAAQQTFQILAVDVLHRQKVLAIHLVDVIDPANVGMSELPGQAHLAQKQLKAPRALGDAARQEFERHRMTELQVIGAIDLSHAAPAGEGHDAIAAGGFGSRQEPAMCGRIRVGTRRGSVRVLRRVVIDRCLRPRHEHAAAGRAELAVGVVFGGASGAGFHGSLGPLRGAESP
jgi:hypothetical protein